MDNIELLNLPKLNNINDLKHLLMFTDKQLKSFILLKEQHYASFRIPKKNSNKKRIINAPKKRLKMAQKIILSEILEKIPCSVCSTAFLKGQNGLLKNALAHKDNLFLLKMDFNNFFQSIKYNKVLQLFMSFGYSLEVSDLLAELCTFCKELPQGGICSPYLSNLACLEIDKKLLNYCNGKDISYTRYADDLIFSTNEMKLLEKLKNEMDNILEEFKNDDFQISINTKKTKLIKEPWHKKVTGVTINDNQIKASKKLKREIRQELFFALKNTKQDNNRLIGLIAYVKSIENEYGEKIRAYAKLIANKHKIQQNDLVDIINKMTA